MYQSKSVSTRPDIKRLKNRQEVSKVSLQDQDQRKKIVYIKGLASLKPVTLEGHWALHETYEMWIAVKTLKAYTKKNSITFQSASSV